MKDNSIRPDDAHLYLTVQEVANLLRVSRMTILRMIWRGDLPSIKFGQSRNNGRPHRILKTDLDKLKYGTMED